MDADQDEVFRSAIRKWGYGQPLLSMRAGYRAVASFRPGIDLELKEW